MKIRTKGMFEFEDIWNRRVVVRYHNLWEKLVYRLQLLYLMRIRKCLKTIWHREWEEPIKPKQNFSTKLKKAS